MKPLAITTGDHGGIGAEVISKGLLALSQEVAPQDIVIFGHPELYEPFRKYLPEKWVLLEESVLSKKLKRSPGALHFISPLVPVSKKKSASDYLCGRYIELATKGALSKHFSGIVTGPIDKNALKRGGYAYDGHTEMLRDLCGCGPVTMMLAAPDLRVSLVTGHIPLSKVARALTAEKILVALKNTHSALRNQFGIKKPRLAVLGLNPHAGDQGLFGSEEQKIIAPAIATAAGKGIKAQGPFAPDGFFAKWKTHYVHHFDAVICMYHDQGLIPVKLHDFQNTVNVTLGLPIVRTSVDHGVGFDISGMGIADPSSFIAALRLAKFFISR